MQNLIWRLFAKLLAWPPIADRLIARSQRTPYMHILSHDESEVYMWRWWLFNPCDRQTSRPRYAWCPWSIRINRIMRPDADRDCHDHPWNARTIILRGWYVEERLSPTDHTIKTRHLLTRGQTGTLRIGEYHRIDHVSQRGVFTLFITGPRFDGWGFLVNGVKVPWRQYLGLREDQDLTQPEKPA